MANGLRTHTITLRGLRITLRPLTGADYPLIVPWYQDPEVLFFSEGAEVHSYSPSETISILEEISQTAHCFMIEAGGRPIGEIALQRMNLPLLLARHPGRDVRRMPVTIGEKGCWGKGFGTEAIRLLTRFAFTDEKVDILYAVGIGSYNPRSLRAFARVGFLVDGSQPSTHHGAATIDYDLRLDRSSWTDLPPPGTGVQSPLR